MTIPRNKKKGQIQIKNTLNPVYIYNHIVLIKYLSSVLNLLKATTYMAFPAGQIGGQIGGQIAQNIAIQCNLTHLDVIEGTVGVHFEASKKKGTKKSTHAFCVATKPNQLTINHHLNTEI